MRHTEKEIEKLLRHAVADALKVRPEEVDAAVPLFHLGLSSVELTQIAARLQKSLGVRIRPSAMWDHPSLSALAQFLASRTDSHP